MRKKDIKKTIDSLQYKQLVVIKSTLGAEFVVKNNGEYGKRWMVTNNLCDKCKPIYFNNIETLSKALFRSNVRWDCETQPGEV